jgi:hypothetical protein
LKRLKKSGAELRRRLKRRYWQSQCASGPGWFWSRYPLPRRIYNRLREHWRGHWQFYVGTALAVGGIVLALIQ